MVWVRGTNKASDGRPSWSGMHRGHGNKTVRYHLQRGKLAHSILGRIVNFASNNPEHGIGSVTSNDVSPMLLQFVGADFPYVIAPCTHNRRDNLRIHEMLHSPIAEIEK